MYNRYRCIVLGDPPYGTIALRGTETAYRRACINPHLQKCLRSRKCSGVKADYDGRESLPLGEEVVVGHVVRAFPLCFEFDDPVRPGFLRLHHLLEKRI